jgi:hypothetical protein
MKKTETWEKQKKEMAGLIYEKHVQQREITQHSGKNSP